MTTHDKRGFHAGQVLFVGFDGTELNSDTAEFLCRVRPGGIILFRRNIADPAQTLKLLSDVGTLYEPGPILAVDEEGGRVSRLGHLAPSLPPAADLSRRPDPGRVASLGKAQGMLLRSLGFHLDFSPVVDLSPPDARNGIGDRSFGGDPEIVCSLAGAYLEGLEESGVLGCLKHFPGLGPTTCDSHLDLPTVEKPEEDFMREDLLPYRRLHSRTPAIMVGHGHYPFLAGQTPVAATLVPRIASWLLRKEVGFQGVAIADDLEMKAVAGRVPYRDLAVRAVVAGCDMTLVCHSRRAIIESMEGLERALLRGTLKEGRFSEAVGRIEDLRGRLPRNIPRSLESFNSCCAVLQSLVTESG